MIGPFPLEMLAARDHWKQVAREHGWHDPSRTFPVQVWVGPDGHVTDSVAFRTLEDDIVLEDDDSNDSVDDDEPLLTRADLRWFMEQRPAHVTYSNWLVCKDPDGNVVTEREVSWTDGEWEHAPPPETWGPFHTTDAAMDCGVYHEGYV